MNAGNEPRSRMTVMSAVSKSSPVTPSRVGAVAVRGTGPPGHDAPGGSWRIAGRAAVPPAGSVIRTWRTIAWAMLRTPPSGLPVGRWSSMIRSTAASSRSGLCCARSVTPRPVQLVLSGAPGVAALPCADTPPPRLSPIRPRTGGPLTLPFPQGGWCRRPCLLLAPGTSTREGVPPDGPGRVTAGRGLPPLSLASASRPWVERVRTEGEL